MRSLKLELTLEESEKVAPRFWSKVKHGDNCWEWIGNSLKGRGLFKFKSRSVYAPRMAYALDVGSIPAGLNVCHTCDNPACVRPSHLFLGTDADNAKDRDDKGRQARGETNGRAVLTESDVYNIRDKINRGWKLTEISELGYSYYAIVDIKRGKSWKHIPNPFEC